MVETDPRPTVGRSRLIRELRHARRTAQMTQLQVADELGWSVSKVIRVERGQVGISRTDVKALLACYRVTDQEEIDRLVELAHEGRRQAWGAYRDVLNPEYLFYLGYEGHAARLWQFEPLVIPGILQTPAYARALIESVAKAGTSDSVIQRQVDVRLARQTLLERDDGPDMHFVIDEGALRRWVGAPGGSGIMIEQLERLKKLTQRSTVRIQVLPFSFGSHVGLAGGFAILEFDDPDEAPLLFLENGHPKLISRDKPEQIEQYRRVFRELQRGASEASQLPSVIDDILASFPASLD